MTAPEGDSGAAAVGRNDRFDVVVVGSGAAGGMAAFALTRAGARVCMLEAGRDYDPRTETPMFGTAAQAPLRGVPTPDKVFGFYDATIDGGWEVPGEPYTVAAGDRFVWWRARMLGGRTNHWGRISLRYAPHDLKPRSTDGLGVDWPLDYPELAHYYDRVERLIGVFGSRDGLEDAPDSPPGVLLPPPALRAHELYLQQAGKRIGRPIVAAHSAVLTRPHNGRTACIYATPCLRGCSLGANFQSTTVLLPPALKTGRMEIRTRAMAYEVGIDGRGRASGVHYVDKVSGAHRFVAGKAVMLAAGAMESVRILFNSKSARFPHGIGNENGHLGRHITDTVGSTIVGQIPALESLPPHNDFGASVDHVYVPWWGLADKRAGRLDFPRGYHLELGGGRQEPNPFMLSKLAGLSAASHGVRLKDEMRRYFGSIVAFMHRGEMIPNERSYVEIDPQVKDRWGIPVLRFRFQRGEHEIRQTVHAQRSGAELIQAAGGRVIEPEPADGEASVGGAMIHEVGGARMGEAPQGSVVDSHGCVWAVRNLCVIDGGVFPSHSHKNPTLTILALAWRASDYLLAASRHAV